MGKRLFYCVILSVLFFAMASGCTQTQEKPLQTEPYQAGQTEVEQEEYECTDNDFPLMIMVGGTLYINRDALELSAKIDDDQILGHISSTVDLSQLPTQDEEANFPAALDAPYACWSDEQYSDAIVVYFAQQWYVFAPENQVS